MTVAALARRRSQPQRWRLLAWLRANALDAALAAGADPATDRRLAARVARLTDRRRVLALAAGLENAVEEAARAHEPISAAVRVRRTAVLAARDELLALAAALRTTPQPPARALALSRRLLVDRSSPLYSPDDDTLRKAVREALRAFDARHDAYPQGM